MFHYSTLPLELRLIIAEFLTAKDLKSLIETNHSHHLLLTPLLHKLATQDYYGMTPLCWAVYRGHEPLVKLLLSMGADINKQFTKGQTVLHYAAFQGNSSMAKLLLENGIDVNLHGLHNASALQVAVGLGTESFLCSLGCFFEPDIPGLGLNEDEGERLVMAQLMLDHGAEVNYQFIPSKWSALHVAVFMRLERIVKLLLENGADTGAVDYMGCTPLHTAASSYRSGGERIARALMEYGADLKTEDNSGSTVLHLAALTKNMKIARLFLSNGADVYARNSQGWTPFSYAMKDPWEGLGGVKLGIDEEKGKRLYGVDHQMMSNFIVGLVTS